MNNITKEIEAMESALADLKAKANEPTLTPVSFDSKRELAQALIDGRTFLSADGHVLSFMEEEEISSPFRIGFTGMTNTWEELSGLREFVVVSVEPWYMNIPASGVECYVSDFNRDPGHSGTHETIFGFEECFEECFDTKFPFRTKDNVGWKYAVPVDSK
jgi:hypothetical protein